LNILPTLERKRIYDEVRRLKQTDPGIDTRTLRRELGTRFQVLPSRMTLQRWLNGVTSPTTSMKGFDATPSDDLSFFLGAWIGDGWADESDGGKRLLLKVRSYDFAKEFADCAARILGKTDTYWVRRVVAKNGKWYLVKVTSLLLYDFVNGPMDELERVIGFFPRGFIRGIYTAEGNPSVSIQSTKRPRLDVGLCITNSDLPMLNTVRNLLQVGGFSPGKLKIDREKGESTNLSVAKRAIWQFNLSKLGDAERFAKSIGFADSEKQGKLEEAITLVRRHGSFVAASRWRMLYQKVSGTWVRTEGRPTDAS